MRRILCLCMLACIASSINLFSRERSTGEILSSASRVLIKNGNGVRRSPSRNQTLKVLEKTPLFTVVGFEEGSYAIVSNDDLLPEVVAYSSTPYIHDSDNPGFNWWLRSISDAAGHILATGEAPLRIAPDPSRVAPEVPQLLSDIWGQMEPFNNLCPLEYDASGRLVGRTVVGCVATSATQVMRYHQYPYQGQGVHIDLQTEDAFGKPIPLKVDFKDYVFDYSKMKDSYSKGTYTKEEGDAVASFAYPVGVSFGMIYGTEASGTFSDSAAYALKTYLKFPDVKHMERFNYQEDVWMSTIFNELSNHRPVLYSGADDLLLPGGGGHAFVLDGYDADGMVHVNWGWYGRNNGYYDITLLNPRHHSFKNQQDMIIGVAPPSRGVNYGKTLTLTGELGKEDLDRAVRLSKEEGYTVLDLRNASLPEGKLPQKAFYSSAFYTILLPGNLLSIGDGAFGNCRNLTEVVFPAPADGAEFAVENDIIYTKDFKEVIEVLPYYSNNDVVITDYNSLLKFREGVTKLHDYAADGCFRISGVEIPSSVTEVGRNAFSNATNLKVVTSSALTPPSAAIKAFSSLDPSYTMLYVPAGYADTYCRAGEWGAFFAFDNVFEYGTTVRARNIVRAEGQPNPELTYQIFGDYVTGEPELSCDADEKSPAGDYVIKVAKGTLSGENIILNDGVLRVLDMASVDDILQELPVGDIFTLDGRIVGNGAEAFNRLAPGIYIVNGKKIIKN